MFELRNVTKIFGDGANQRIVLNNCSYTFKPGVSYLLTGYSGIGKSTLLHLLAGFEPVSTGAVFYNGTSLEEMKELNRARYERFLLNDIGVVFQSPCLIPELSVLENIGFKGFAAGMPLEDIMDAARNEARQVGLSSHEDQPIATFSGGQQQRVAFARALFIKPAFLLLDEPTAHIDKKTAQDIIALLKQAQRDGVGIIMASHDPVLRHEFDVVIELRNGELHVCS